MSLKNGKGAKKPGKDDKKPVTGLNNTLVA
jgi:hypothetical protein